MAAGSRAADPRARYLKLLAYRRAMDAQNSSPHCSLLAGVIVEKYILVFQGQIFGFTADQVQNSGRIETGSK